MSPTVDLAVDLVNRPSITPHDEGCQPLIAARLKKLGFTITHLPFEDVSNLWAVSSGSGPTVCLAGHTDVVPSGPLTHWQTPPFTPTIKGGVLYGRGVADMKGGVAAMVCAVEQTNLKKLNGRIALLLTSDEEGPALHGTKRAMAYLNQQGQIIDYCLIGEPSSVQTLGDTIKIGRRGSINGRLTIHGKAGHVAYPHLAENAAHAAFPILTQLAQLTWVDTHPNFPETSLQFSNIQAGIGVNNVIPHQLTADFNIRNNPHSPADEIEKRMRELLNAQHLNYDLEWHVSGQPFLTQKQTLIKIVTQVVEQQLNRTPVLSTAGGTSDGRFIAPYDVEVVELGLPSQNIHQPNESARISDLDQLTTLYRQIITQLLS